MAGAVIGATSAASIVLLGVQLGATIVAVFAALRTLQTRQRIENILEDSKKVLTGAHDILKTLERRGVSALDRWP